MNSAPFCTKKIQILGQCVFDLSKLPLRKTMVLAHFRRPEWAVQIEYRLAISPDNMHMGGAMIVRINHYPDPAESLDCWHYTR